MNKSLENQVILSVRGDETINTNIAYLVIIFASKMSPQGAKYRVLSTLPTLKTIYVHDPMSHFTLLFDQFCKYMLKLTHKMS